MASRKDIRNKMGEILELPKEIVNNIPRITVLGFNKMLVESYKTIIEYNENYIKLSTRIGFIIIEGFNLQVNQITNDDAQIEGQIVHIEFEKYE